MVKRGAREQGPKWKIVATTKSGIFIFNRFADAADAEVPREPASAAGQTAL